MVIWCLAPMIIKIISFGMQNDLNNCNLKNKCNFLVYYFNILYSLFVVSDRNQKFQFSYTHLPMFDLKTPKVVAFQPPLTLDDIVADSV